MSLLSHMRVWRVVFLCVCIFFPLSATAKVVSAHVKSTNTWLLVDRFCFTEMPNYRATNTPAVRDEGEGLFRVTTFFKKKDRVSVSLFFDENDQWSDVAQATATDMMCNQRQNAATKTFHMWEGMQCKNPDCSELIDMPFVNDSSILDDEIVEVTREFQFRGLTRKWFYIVLSNCDPTCAERDDDSIKNNEVSPFGFCQGFLDVKYTFVMLNGESEADEHFSADELGVRATTQAFFALQCINVMGIVVIRSKLVHRKKFHWTVFILMCCIGMTFLSNCLALSHYTTYASDGIGAPRVLVVSQYIKLATDALFTLLLLLLAKGWTIVRRKISPDGRVKLAMFVTVQTCLSIFAVTWSQYSYDIAEVTYFYESAPGVMLCVLRVAGALWFLRAAQTTANNFEKKRGFYGKFNKFFFSYMLIVPVAVALATAAETYYRFMLVYGVETAATWFGQTLLMLLYNPSTQFNRSFPFHSHTSSMLGMYGKSKDNTKASTLMVSSNRNNRLQQGPQSPGAPPPLVATPNVLQSQYRAAATNSTINTVSGGLGVQKSRAGQVVVTNQFDADHFLRIKDASDIIRGELRELVERAEKLDRVLDAVTIENASSYGVLGDRYLRGQAEKESQKRIALEATARTNQYAVANPNGLSGSLPKKIGRRSGAGGGTDWMKGIENVDAAGDSKVLEMVTRVGGSSASALAKSIDAEKEKRENEKELLKKPSMPVVENKKKAVEEEEKKKLEKGPEPGVEEYKAAPEEEVKEERGEMPQTSPAMPNPDEDSEDEFDRAFSAAPAKPAAEKKVPPKGPPPGKPPSRSGSRQTSRENSPRTSRQSSRDNSPRAGDSSRDASPRPGGDGGDAKEGEQEKKVKKKKVKKEKRRGSKDLPAVSRGGSKENSARIEYHN